MLNIKDILSGKRYAYDVIGRRSTYDVIQALKSWIGHDNWFISGSFANKKVDSFNDIDVFFYTEEELLAAQKNAGNTGVYKTTNAATVSKVPGIDVSVQLIKTRTGTPKEVFKGFDLNVCKKALLPNNTYVIDENSDNPIKICNVSSNTFKRYVNYHYKLNEYLFIQDRAKKVIDTYISDHTMLRLYYDNKEELMQTNVAMFNAFIVEDCLQQYLIEQATMHAPELLV